MNEIVDSSSSSSSPGKRALWWVSFVALFWVVLVVERLSGYRIAGAGTAALVLHAVGSVLAIVTAALLWKRSKRFWTATVTLLCLLSTAPIAALDWRSLNARYFFLAHRNDFVAMIEMVRRGYLNSDDSGGVTLSGDLGYLSPTGRVAAGYLNNDQGNMRAVFLSAGRVGSCNTGYLDLEQEFPGVDVLPLCRIRMPLGGGWMWLD